MKKKTNKTTNNKTMTLTVAMRRSVTSIMERLSEDFALTVSEPGNYILWGGDW